MKASAPPGAMMPLLKFIELNVVGIWLRVLPLVVSHPSSFYGVGILLFVLCSGGDRDGIDYLSMKRKSSYNNKLLSGELCSIYFRSLNTTFRTSSCSNQMISEK